MKLPQAKLISLDCGARLVHIHQHSVATGIFGLLVRAGSADDPDGRHGLAHLVEHTLFKGTAKRSSWHIVNRMEVIGGELNAFTTKEITAIYAISPGTGCARAIELIIDLAANSQFPDKEVEKEREVVLDEIETYRDIPAEAAFDDLEDLVFADSALGHNILGSRDSVAALTADDCRRFVRRHYTAANSVFYYSGPQSPEKVAAQLAKAIVCHNAFQDCHEATVISRPAVFNYKEQSVELPGIHQCHCILGIEAASYGSPERFADALFANIIGGPGMNSLLNLEMRERRGLVYNVESNVTNFSDTGLMTIYWGCDPDDNARCLQLKDKVMHHLLDIDARAMERLLQRGRRQFLGQSIIAAENRENRIVAAAKHALFFNTIPQPNALAEGIAAVSAEAIRRRAEAFLSSARLEFLPAKD